MILTLLLLLNIAFVIAIWHLDLNHNLDRLGQKQTRGILKISPEKGYRYSQYVLLICLFLLDILFVITFFNQS